MPPASPKQRPLSVTAVNRAVKRLLEGRFPSLVVLGEVSEVTKPRSGHVYFTLKDERSQLRCVLWRTQAARLDFELQSGTEVVCRGGLDVYPPRGSYQLVAQSIQPVGRGDLQQRLRRLHRQLESEGYFDAAKKRPLPPFARHLVLVTSPTGAAVRDFLEVARRRWPHARITVAPVRVQGEGAGVEIAHMVRRLQRLRPAPDVLVVTRGGGSADDLWCFNDEALVRAIHDSTIPVVSAVGHEIDVSLSDLAADVRALTPSEAAERTLPSADDMQQRLRQFHRRLANGLRQRSETARRRLDHLRQRRALRQPLDMVRSLQRELDEWQQRADRAASRCLQHARRQLAAEAARLESLSPLAVLSRGYSLTTDQSGELVSSVQQLAPGDAVQLRFHDGEAAARIDQTQQIEQTPAAPDSP